MQHEQDRRRAVGRSSLMESSASSDADRAVAIDMTPGKRTLVDGLTASSEAPIIQRAVEPSAVSPHGGGRPMPLVSRAFTLLSGGVLQRAADAAQSTSGGLPFLQLSGPSPAIQRAAAASSAAPAGADSRRELPAEVRGKMESAMNADFSAVRIHEGPQAPAVGALAYTQGTDVHFAPGRYDPQSQSGQALIGHELAHVVQQSQGRVTATAQAKADGGASVMLNDDAALESEADEIGARAARGEPAAVGPRLAIGGAASGPVQLFRDYQAVHADSSGGGGGVYKLIRMGGFHIKLHPTPGNEEVWDEFHVTFELFDDDKLCPKVYFSDEGIRDASHDNDFVNRNYIKNDSGKGNHPKFEDLIEDAKQHAATFLKGAPKLLSAKEAQQLKIEREQERERLENKREQENKQNASKYEEHEKSQEKQRFTAYSDGGKLFGQSGGIDEKEQIMTQAGLDPSDKKTWATVKMFLWNKTKDAWEKDNLGEVYDKIQVIREKAKTPKVEPPKTTEPTKEQVSQAMEGHSQDQVVSKLKEVKPTESQDSQALVARGIPTPLIMLILAFGIYVLLRLFGMVG